MEREGAPLTAACRSGDRCECWRRVGRKGGRECAAGPRDGSDGGDLAAEVQIRAARCAVGSGAAGPDRRGPGARARPLCTQCRVSGVAVAWLHRPQHPFSECKGERGGGWGGVARGALGRPLLFPNPPEGMCACGRDGAVELQSGCECGAGAMLSTAQCASTRTDGGGVAPPCRGASAARTREWGPVGGLPSASTARPRAVQLTGRWAASCACQCGRVGAGHRVAKTRGQKTRVRRASRGRNAGARERAYWGEHGAVTGCVQRAPRCAPRREGRRLGERGRWPGGKAVRTETALSDKTTVRRSCERHAQASTARPSAQERGRGWALPEEVPNCPFWGACGGRLDGPR